LDPNKEEDIIEVSIFFLFSHFLEQILLTDGLNIYKLFKIYYFLKYLFLIFFYKNNFYLYIFSNVKRCAEALP
jgi:hypothetical protein